jgi:hypothetical protein
VTDSSEVSTAIAMVTRSMVHEFDIPTILQIVADRARVCFDAHSAIVVLLDPRHVAGTTPVHVVAEATIDGVNMNPLLSISGPALDSARSGATALVIDLSDADDTRWPDYRRRALKAGFRGVRAFPIIGVGAPLGSVVIHTIGPWSDRLPNQAGHVFADLTSLALSAGSGEGLSGRIDDTVDDVLEGTTLVATAVGIIAQVRDSDIHEARLTLMRLARARGVTPTEHARAILDAQRRDPQNPAATGIFDSPELPIPPRID